MIKFSITDKAKKKMSELQRKNIPIKLTKIKVGWSGYFYGIVSEKQKENDIIYEVDGYNIIVSSDAEDILAEAKIDYLTGFFRKTFTVNPKYKSTDKINNI